MRASITFLGRVASHFVAVEIHKGTPIPLPGASSYYARFTEDGKRQCLSLGKDFTGAVLKFQNMEIVREYKSRNLTVPGELAVPVAVAAPKSATLRERIKAYSIETKDHKSRATWSAYTNTLAFFEKSCERTAVNEITREDLLAFKVFLRGQHLGKRSVYNNFLNVMVFLKWCGVKTAIKKDDWPPKPEREPEEFSEDELTNLLTAAYPEERLVMNCFLCSGLRTGELIHLTYGDIDFKYSVWTVQPKEDWSIKTKRAQRDVPVPPWLTAKLYERMVASGRGKNDLIFFNRNGQPDQNILHVLKRVAKRINLTGRVDDHKFRSTAITRWLRDGNTIPDVMSWVGHAHPTMILRYAAKLNVRKAETLKKASGAFTRFAGVGD